jgi:vesicle coat complex subunit
MREMSLAISQKPMSETSKAALKPFVLRRLGDEAPSVRKEAVIALFFVGGRTDVTNLDSMVADTDPEVSKAALRVKTKLAER